MLLKPLIYGISTYITSNFAFLLQLAMHRAETEEMLINLRGLFSLGLRHANIRLAMLGIRIRFL